MLLCLTKKCMAPLGMSTWLVSDLKSKLSIQKRLLDQNPFLEEDAILRASELWKKILFRVRPEWRLVSYDLVSALIEEQMQKSEYEWARVPGTTSLMMEFVSLFCSVYSHPEGYDRMGDWFRLNPFSYSRWGEWFVEGERIFRFLKTKKVFPQSWAASLLLNEEIPEKAWSRPLTVDLGPDLNPVEAELISRLAKRIEVQVLKPNVSRSERFERLLRPYSTFESVSQKDPVNVADRSASISCYKLATQLSEVKNAVALVRQEIEKGIAPSQIAVTAPDVKVYWRTLDLYFKEEGIPVSKERASVLNHFSDLTIWLSEIAVRTQEFSGEALEHIFYSPERYGPMPFDKFRSLYARVYGDDDLARDKSVYEKIGKRQIGKDLTREEFIGWSLNYFPSDGDVDRLEGFIKNIVQECPASTKMNVRSWSRYFQSRASRSDVVLEPSSEGVEIINIDSVEGGTFKVIVALGLTEDSLRESESQIVDASELFSITAKTGFVFACQDPNRLEFKLRVIAQGDSHFHFSVPGSDFNGNIVAPSLFWLETANAYSAESLNTVLRPLPSSWDNLQESDFAAIADIRKWSNSKRERMWRRLKADLGEGEDDLFNSKNWSHLSASSLEEFFKCPFRFAARKVFRLETLPELDLDIDPLSKGRLMHKVFERLLVEPFKSSRSESELEAIIDQARREIDIQIGEDRFWPVTRANLVKLARRLLAFEGEWRQRFPQTTTIGREVEIAGFLNLTTGEFGTSPDEASVKVFGSIDRVDADREGNTIVLDYKSSANELKQVGSWIEEQQLQLLFYVAALEAGLTPLGARTALGAFYFVVKNLDRNRGFKLIESTGTLFDIEGRAKNKLSKEEKEELFEKFRGLVVQFGQESAKSLLPNPKDPQKCDICNWNKVCRAKHLN